MRPLMAILAVVICGAATAGKPAHADNWPRWRGPQADGAAVGEAFPLRWQVADGKEEGVRWKYKLPGIGASTPIVWQDAIFVSGANGGKNSLLRLNRQGEKQWEVLLGDERTAKNRKASGSNPSPVTDGKYVAVYFKSGELACLDYSGAVLWRINLQEKYGKDTLWWDLGTSPVMTHKHVVIACMQTGGSYLIALDKATGDVAWKQSRDLDAPNESAQSYTTPVVLTEGDRQILIVLGADHVTAHDAATGEQLWIFGTLNPNGRGNWRSIASPIVAQDIVVAPYGRGATLTAIGLGGSGDVTKTHRLWEVRDAAADVPSPAVDGQRVFTCSDRGKITMLDLKSGKILAQANAPRSRAAYSSSPIFAAGHLYVTNEEGATFVMKVGDTSLELVAENTVGEFTVATPIFVDGLIYLRADEHLFCLGAKE